MADEDAIFQANRQGAGADKPKGRIADEIRRIAIRLLQAASEGEIEHAAGFHNRVVGQLSQFMIAEKEMELIGETIFQRCHPFEQCMRHATAGLHRITWPTVANFLHDEMTARVSREVGDFDEFVEMGSLAVKIGADNDIVGNVAGEFDDIPHAERTSLIRIGRSVKEVAGGLRILGGRNHGIESSSLSRYAGWVFRQPTDSCAIVAARQNAIAGE